YRWSCEFDAAAGCYRSFRYEAASEWAAARVDVRDTGEPAGLLAGFTSPEEQTLVLTHPVDGYFYRLDGKLGTYSVSHDVLEFTTAEVNELRFDLLERLGVVRRDEMNQPHSVLLCRETT